MWRLPAIILGTFVVTAFVWASIYMWGLSRPIFKYQVEVIPESGIYVVWDSQASGDIPADIGAAIYLSNRDDNWYCNKERCEELLPAIVGRSIFVRIDQNTNMVHEKFLALADQFGLEKIVFTSKYPVVISAIKERQPKWVYGTSDVEVARVKIFEAMGLLHVPEIKADVWTSSFDYNGRRTISPRLVDDLKRRSKSLVVEQVTTPEAVVLAKGLGADAVVIEPDLYLAIQ